MIRLHSYKRSGSGNLSDISNHDSILIIGKAETENKLHEVYKPVDINDMEYTFGNSELTTAYIDCINNGGSNVFVVNAYKTSDIIESINYIKSLNFAYIIPLGFKLTDTFYDDKSGRVVYFIEYFLKNLFEYTNSTLIVTEDHAEFYENIDHYLKDMHNKVDRVRVDLEHLLEYMGENLLFCLNNLKEHANSNVILGAKLASSNIGKYPNQIKSKAIFDLNNYDIDFQEIIYFKNNFIIDTSIENLNNFRVQKDANKVVTVNMAFKYIERTIDLSFLVGKLYNNYLIFSIKEYLDEYMRGIKDVVIRDYRISKIDFLANSSNYTGQFLIDLKIQPLNSLEILDISLEVG